LYFAKEAEGATEMPLMIPSSTVERLLGIFGEAAVKMGLENIG